MLAELTSEMWMSETWNAKKKCRKRLKFKWISVPLLLIFFIEFIFLPHKRESGIERSIFERNSIQFVKSWPISSIFSLLHSKNSIPLVFLANDANCEIIFVFCFWRLQKQTHIARAHQKFIQRIKILIIKSINKRNNSGSSTMSPWHHSTESVMLTHWRIPSFGKIVEYEFLIHFWWFLSLSLSPFWWQFFFLGTWWALHRLKWLDIVPAVVQSFIHLVAYWNAKRYFEFFFSIIILLAIHTRI